MAHGYLREGYGMWGDYDPDREGRDRDRDWRDRDRDRPFMFSDRDRERSDAREWFGGRGDQERSFSSNRDDHYRSWRDRQMEALDRDYADYCREREQQFHQEFDNWRSQRRSNPQPLQTGMAQTGMSHDPTGMTQAEATQATNAAEDVQDPVDTATLGTSSGRRGR
jgi:hypothetical protein